MKKRLLFLYSLLASSLLFGQTTFIISALPVDTPSDATLFVAGSYNGWNPGDPDYELALNEGAQWQVIMPSQNQGTVISFKFTRGDWNTVEKGINGEEIVDRQFTYGNGDTVYFNIATWADQVGGGNSTAAENVSVLDAAFYIPELDRTRRVWIYLPPDYYLGTDNYPVLYMHDGQNVFDAFTSYVGEWEVDETLNVLYEQGIPVPIVVGIDHGGTERINEYLPWINPQYGGGLGDEYMNFLVHTLKPYIDENYRTLSGREYTGLMGSSMGGLISQYGILKYQNVFSKGGIFSPAYWISDSIWSFTSAIEKQYPLKCYQLIGSDEGEDYVDGMWNMQDSLLHIGFDESEVLSLEISGGQHTESFWRNQFEKAYLWMFATFVDEIAEHYSTMEVELVPNPVNETIDLSSLGFKSIDSIQIFGVDGSLVMNENGRSMTLIYISELKPGNYLLVIHASGKIYRSRFAKC